MVEYANGRLFSPSPNPLPKGERALCTRSRSCGEAAASICCVKDVEVAAARIVPTFCRGALWKLRIETGLCVFAN